MGCRRVVPHLVLIALALAPGEARSWGPLGHRMVAETAALLLEKDLPEGWGPFLARHRFEMGYYAIVPDSVFRHKDGRGGKLEGPTHFLDLDLILGSIPLPPDANKQINEIPGDYNAAEKHLVAKIGRKKFEAAGSSPWRVLQLQHLARRTFKDIRIAQGTYQTGKQSKGDTGKIFKGIYYLGVLSHYTGDATMPYHATSDWNGYQVGHGGIHFYLESDCVNALEPGLSADVLESAMKNRKEWLESWKTKELSTVGLMLHAYLDSASAIERVNQIDKDSALIQPSPIGEKTPASRKAPAVGCTGFRSLLIERLAKAAVLTASVWEAALPKNVDFSKSSALQFADFELNPQYIRPDYNTASRAR